MGKRGRIKKHGILFNQSEIISAQDEIIHPIDKDIGAKLKTLRLSRDVSQDQLGKAVGLTFQQIQKYERGANRISCSRLWEFSQLLNVDISYFFHTDGES